MPSRFSVVFNLCGHEEEGLSDAIGDRVCTDGDCGRDCAAGQAGEAVAMTTTIVILRLLTAGGNWTTFESFETLDKCQQYAERHAIHLAAKKLHPRSTICLPAGMEPK